MLLPFCWLELKRFLCGGTQWHSRETYFQFITSVESKRALTQTWLRVTMGVTCWVSVLLASQNNNPIKVYSVANYRTQLSHVWANVISTIPTWSLNFCLLFNRAEIWLVLYIFYRSSQDQVNQQNEGYLTVNSALLRSCKSGRDFALGQFYLVSVFLSVSIRFLINRWPYLSPPCQTHGCWAWVRNCIPVTPAHC